MSELYVPHNVEAEQAVIGALLLEPELAYDAAEKLKPAHFYVGAHRIIFETILRQLEAGKPADIVTIGSELAQHEAFAGKEVISYLAEIAGTVPTTATFSRYVELVLEEAVRRQMFMLGKRLMEKARDRSEPVTDLLDKTEQVVLSLSLSSTETGPQPIGEIAEARWQHLYSTRNDPGVLGISTGFVDLDKMLGGLEPSEYILLAARPSMGKTACSLQIARHVAGLGKGSVLFFSLEMSKEMLVDRYVCADAKLSHTKLKRRELTEEEWDKGSQALIRLSQLDLIIDDRTNTTSGIRSIARKIKRSRGLALIVVDYLQFLADKPERGQNSQNDIVSAISKRLKDLAKELQVPLIALSQLNRSTERRGDHRPMLSDLRDSGSLEQDADQVWFIHRPEYYDPDDKPGIAEIIVAKNRNGPTGVIELSFVKKYAMFGNLAKTGGWTRG